MPPLNKPKPNLRSDAPGKKEKKPKKNKKTKNTKSY